VKNTVQTRQRGNIYNINKCKTSEEQKMLLHNGYKIYNNLPKNIKSEQSLNNFKRALVSCIKGREKKCTSNISI